MFTACMFYLAMLWAIPSGMTCTDLDAVRVYALDNHVDPLGGYSVPMVEGNFALAFTGYDGFSIFLQPEAWDKNKKYRSYLRNVMRHELEHAFRIRAGLFNGSAPDEEERIATRAACAEAWAPQCEP